MAFRLKMSPLAEIEFFKAIEYYESKKMGLGLEFYTIVLEYFDIIISETPVFQIKHASNIREVPIRKFPYVINYEIFEEKNLVFILGVYNTYQDWNKKRLRN